MKNIFKDKSWYKQIAEFFNGPEPQLNSSILFLIHKERQEELEREHYRLEKFWKPLWKLIWKLFLIGCVFYTISNVIPWGPPYTPEELNELRR